MGFESHRIQSLHLNKKAAMFNYYGLDWAIFGLLIIHMWMLGNKWRSAWVVGIFVYILGLPMACMMGSVASFIMNCLFIVLGVRAYITWSK